ncbi:OsmC family protein [Sphingomonas sp. NPDC092331]|jgi:lipoyl-dependent peroxiredoxin|uniref:OsmC family protein n=1 Tax=unclassified Sphingomonas TaxID=196159 RepID=UPI002454B567|nr:MULTISPECIES: OsmC family protein [unclassified Sphingomonas]MBQ1498809.1 OsmC family protein [Sphingomonas sp.]MCH7862230.1 OsmC family protein [Pseudomonadota bacterium]MDH4745978.1 OsmC family protein [Sphingomonas sp. CBMAI 2297]
MTTRTATARYEGFGKEGKGHITTQSGVLTDQFYGFNTRFADEPGTNPEELVAAAHAGCFTMALSFALARAGFSEGSLETRAAVKLEQDGDGFTITRSDLTLKASVPGLAQAQFEALAAGAHANCPVSKLLKAESSLDATLL